MLARLYMIMTLALGLLIPFSFSLPSPVPKDSISLLPRADADCFATAFGINDFKAYSGGDTEPASVSFKSGAKDFNGDLLCSRRGEAGSKSPYFDTPVACNKPSLPKIFFSYPQDQLLRVYEVTTCGTQDQHYLSYAEGRIALFCYGLFGGQMCMTPTGSASLQVTEKQMLP